MTPTAGECTTPESVLPAKYVGGASRRTFGPFRQFSSANDSVARDMTRLAALGLKGIAVLLRRSRFPGADQQRAPTRWPVAQNPPVDVLGHPLDQAMRSA